MKIWLGLLSYSRGYIQYIIKYRELKLREKVRQGNRILCITGIFRQTALPYFHFIFSFILREQICWVVGKRRMYSQSIEIFFIKKQNLKINLVLSLGCIYFSIIRFFLFNLYLHISNSSVSYFTCGSDSKLLALFLLLIVFCMLIRWFHWLAFTFGLPSYFFWHLPQTAYFYRRK